ncbi:hypothetical protein ACFQ4C_20205 [Larkinella insperata]|uniref:Uncharacterized protein n=1 Tax=Larkinella insperata TaxID=332158 RepID=A0ABW3QE94_9BACT|nr:hypothetical protein [Larkinella insperata]
MFLSFSYVNSEGLVNTRSSIGLDLEAIFNLLNFLVAQGDTLLSAFVIDTKGVRTDLPLDVFDGKSIDEHMKNLQKEFRLLVRL